MDESRKTSKKSFFCVFWKKICSARTHCDTDRHESWRTGNRQNRLPDKIIGLALQLSVLRGSSTKSTRASPSHCTQSRLLQISPKSVHVRHSYIRTREHIPSALESESNIRLKPIASSWIIIIALCILLWPPYVIGGPLYRCPVVSIYLAIFFPRLISAAGDWMSTILPRMVRP